MYIPGSEGTYACIHCLGTVLADTTCLHELPSHPTLTFTVHTSAQLSSNSSKCSTPSGGNGGIAIREVGLLTARVHRDSESGEVLVRIYDSSVKKPFLGGYRDAVTDVEYHHASAQTHPYPRPLPQVRGCILLMC